jgi:hypothetical protein
MVSDSVNSWPWKCPDCVIEEGRSTGFRARTLGWTTLKEDGSLETVVAQRRSEHKAIWEPAVRHAREVENLAGIDVRPITAHALKPDEASRVFISDGERHGLLLCAEEEMRVPCGREHGGHGNPDGSWTRGKQGRVRISTAAFLAAAQRLAAS